MPVSPLYLLLCLLPLPSFPDYVGQTVTGMVWEGNYTYYTLKQSGPVRLVLKSVVGDADLYVSGQDMEQPTFLLEEHSLSSASCGEDSVQISEHFPRPIYIGVYGHPRHEISHFLLDVVIVELDEYDPFKEEAQEDKNSDEGRESKSRHNSEEEPFWSKDQGTMKTIFNFLKIILEIVIDIMI